MSNERFGTPLLYLPAALCQHIRNSGMIPEGRPNYIPLTRLQFHINVTPHELNAFAFQHFLQYCQLRMMIAIQM